MADCKLDDKFQKTLSLLLCIRSIHWVVLIWKKSNVPKNIIDLYDSGQKILVEAAKKLPYYLEANGDYEGDAMIDSLHRIEAELEDYSGTADGELHIPASSLALTIELYGLAITKLEKSRFEFDKTHFHRATQKLIRLVKSYASGISEMDKLGQAIDSLLLEDGPSGAN